MKKLSFTFFLWSLVNCLLLAQPVADFNVDNSYGCNLPMTVQFTNNSSGPNGLTYLWDFADGNTSMDSDPTHIYSNYFNYEVCLYVEDDLTGIRDTACQNIVLEAMQSNIDATICAGEVYNLNGVDYNMSGTFNEVILDGAVNGCDSLIILDLTVLDPIVGMETHIGCEGDGYDVLVNGTVYNETNPTGQETLISEMGCDSTITIVLDFNASVTSNVTETLCIDDNIIINATLYDITNPTGIEVMTSISGCDSIINVSLSFYPEAINNIEATLCPGDFIFVNGTSYSELNPIGSEIIPNISSNGCDSIINVVLNFYDIASSDLDFSLCMGESIEIDGVIYDETNPTGQTTISNGSFNGCDSIINVVVTFYAEIIVSSDISNITCSGGANGTIDLMVSGGSGNYNYDWSNGISNVSFITGLNSGTYSVTVTDGEGCSAVSNITIMEPMPMAVTANVINNGCDQTCEGQIDINVFGGTEPYTFIWNNGVNSEDNINLCTGIYMVTITDANNCIVVSEVFDIVDVPNLNISSEDLEITCLVSNVILDPIISGGQMPYTYQWSNGSTAGTEIVNAEGVYAVTITDINGCGGTAIFMVTESLDEPMVSAAITPACNGLDNGSISLNLDATCPVDILWSDGVSNFNEVGVGVGGIYTLIDNALAGNYSVTITDGCTGCSYFESYVVEEGSNITGTFSEQNGVYCPGEDVDICFVPDVTVGTYSWTGPNGFQSSTQCLQLPNISPAFAGCYNLEVTDFNGCTKSFTNCISVYDEIVVSPNLDICLGDSVQLFTLPTNANITSITWIPDDGTLSCLDCLSPYASPVATTNYEVMIGYSTGCFQSANFEVGVDPSCVWPGDTDTNKVVNNFDLLAIGLSYDSIGPIRPNANIGWFGQPGPAWMQNTPGTNVDLEHVDTDGNGMINADDTMAIVANWGDEHMFTDEGGDYQFTNDEVFSEMNAENAPFYVAVDTFIEGETVGLPIILGDVGVPVADLYGIGFSIEYDSALVDASSAFVNFDMSWLGLNNNNMITIQKDFHSPGRIDVALTKTDGQGMTGFGEIARFYITVEDNIFFRPDDTRANEEGLDALFNIVDYMLITKVGEIIEVESMTTTSLLRDVETATINPKLDLLVDLFPNPTNDDIFVTTKNIEIENIQIYNLMGQMVSNWIPENAFSTKLPTHVLGQGSYLVKVQTNEGIWTERLVVVKK